MTTTIRRRAARTVMLLLATAGLAGGLYGLTVERISLERLTRESGVIIRGTVSSTGSRWEGRNIMTVTEVRITDALKGAGGGSITVTQLGGTVGDVTADVPGTPVLTPGDDVVLFLTPWEGRYWIHSIVLGKYSVMVEDGASTVVNDLRNVGLVDPSTGREITGGDEKHQRIPLGAFLQRVRAIVAEEDR